MSRPRDWSKLWLALPGVIVLAMLVYLEWLETGGFEMIWISLGVLAVLIALGRLEKRIVDAKWAKATAPIDPAIAPPAPMDELLDSDAALVGMHGRVREVRSFSAPVYYGDPESGMLVPRYCSVLIDTNGEVHDLESSESFGWIEQRAQRLAERLRVPFESSI